MLIFIYYSEESSKELSSNISYFFPFFNSEQQVDLELPTNQSKTEVDTIVLSKEPKVLFKEKTIVSLGPRGAEHKAVEFKKRKLNSGAAKGNIRRTNNDVDSWCQMS